MGGVRLALCFLLLALALALPGSVTAAPGECTDPANLCPDIGVGTGVYISAATCTSNCAGGTCDTYTCCVEGVGDKTRSQCECNNVLTDTRNNPDNCGSCGYDCDADPAQSSVCQSSLCQCSYYGPDLTPSMTCSGCSGGSTQVWTKLESSQPLNFGGSGNYYAGCCPSSSYCVSRDGCTAPGSSWSNSFLCDDGIFRQCDVTGETETVGTQTYVCGSDSRWTTCGKQSLGQPACPCTGCNTVKDGNWLCVSSGSTAPFGSTDYGKTCCGTDFKDLSSDVFNCGSCGNICGTACESANTCSSGNCRYTCGGADMWPEISGGHRCAWGDTDPRLNECQGIKTGTNNLNCLPGFRTIGSETAQGKLCQVDTGSASDVTRTTPPYYEGFSCVSPMSVPICTSSSSCPPHYDNVGGVCIRNCGLQDQDPCVSTIKQINFTTTSTGSPAFVNVPDISCTYYPSMHQPYDDTLNVSKYSGQETGGGPSYGCMNWNMHPSVKQEIYADDVCCGSPDNTSRFPEISGSRRNYLNATGGTSYGMICDSIRVLCKPKTCLCDSAATKACGVEYFSSSPFSHCTDVSCGTGLQCSAGYTCLGGSCVTDPSCPDLKTQSEACGTKECGTVSDGCDGTYTCGDCSTKPSICHNSTAVKDYTSTCTASSTCAYNIISCTGYQVCSDPDGSAGPTSASCACPTGTTWSATYSRCLEDPAKTGTNGLNACTGGLDDQGDGEYDYAGSGTVKGDAGCPVAVTAISVSPSPPRAGDAFTVTCTASPAGVRSIGVSVTGPSTVSCEPRASWVGNTITFDCTAPTYTQLYTATCFVDTAKSYKAGTDQSTTFTPSCPTNTTAGVDRLGVSRCVEHPSYCANTINDDNLFDGTEDEKDYDGNSGTTHGDFQCKVGIASMSTPAPTVGAGFPLSCTTNVGNLRSIGAEYYLNSAPGTKYTCADTTWSGNTMSFNCPAPAFPQDYTARCYVNYARSYNLTGQGEQTRGFTPSCAPPNSSCSGVCKEPQTGLPCDDLFCMVNEVWQDECGTTCGGGNAYTCPPIVDSCWDATGLNRTSVGTCNEVADRCDYTSSRVACPMNKVCEQPGLSAATCECPSGTTINLATGYCDETSCMDNLDNDGNGQADYDGGTTAMRGDVNCKVGISEARATDGCAGPAGVVQGNCTYAAGSFPGPLKSANATLAKGSVKNSCTIAGWSGLTALFRCPTAGMSKGDATFTCIVNQTNSYNSTPDLSASAVYLGGPRDRCSIGYCEDPLTGICLNNVTWEGQLLDENTRTIIPVGSVRVDKGAYQTVTSAFSINVITGYHNLTGNATGYDVKYDSQVPFFSNKTYYNITLRIAECKSDCSIGGFCDYNQCAGVNGCTLPSDGNILPVCQFARNGSMQTINDTHSAVCCTGPVRSVSELKAPATMVGCSDNIASLGTIMGQDGKVMTVQVVVTAPCK